MANGETLTIELDPELRDALMAEAEASQRPASELAQALLREVFERRRAERENVDYDTWFRAQVQEALDDPSPPIPHEEAMREIDAIFDRAIARHSRK